MNLAKYTNTHAVDLPTKQVHISEILRSALSKVHLQFFLARCLSAILSTSVIPSHAKSRHQVLHFQSPIWEFQINSERDWFGGDDSITSYVLWLWQLCKTSARENFMLRKTRKDYGLKHGICSVYPFFERLDICSDYLFVDVLRYCRLVCWWML